MTALLTDNLPLLAGAPNGIKKLRELILELAVRGKLVEQDARDESASELLKRIAAEKSRLVAEGKIKKQKPLTEIVEEEKPFELPAGWEWSQLGQISSDVQYGFTASADHQNGEPLLLRITDIQNNGVNWDTVPGCDISPAEIAGYELKDGDIVIARTGGTIGKSYLVSGLTHSAVFASYLIRIGRLDSIYPDFTKVFLGSQFYWKQIYARSMGTGQPNVNGTALKGLLIPLPPMAEQHRIVAKVDELMDMCDSLETQQTDAACVHAQLVRVLLGSLTQASDATEFAANWQRLAEHFHTLFSTESSIDALKQTLLQLAVMGKLVPQDPADEPASEMLKRIQVEKLRLVAEGKLKKQKQLAAIDEDEKPYQLPPLWQWSRLGSQVIESGAGWSPSCEPRRRGGKEWGVLKVSAVSWGLYRPEENKALPAGLDPRPEHEVAEGDFLVSRANTAELVARSVVVENTPVNLMLSDKIVRLKLTSICDRRYVNFVNSSAFAREYYGRVAAGTSSSMKNVSREQILGLLIPLPPLAEQHRIVAKVDQLMVLCDQLKTQLSQARQLNQQLASTLVEQAVA
jgi:type I restriction enzyme S subunit